MKVSRGLANPLFIPFTVSITVESGEEARALYAIFNHASASHLLRDEVVSRIKDAIGREHYVASGHIANKVTYDEHYHRSNRH